MQLMKNALAALAVAGLATGGTVVTAQDRDEPTKGSTVTLTSCVEKGKKDNTFILTHVADMPAHPQIKGARVVYWLDQDTAKKLAPHAGHQIRVVGKITDVDQREIETKVTDEGVIAEIEGPGRNVQTSAAKAGVPASPTDVKTTLVKLKADKIEMVSDRCNLTR